MGRETIKAPAGPRSHGSLVIYLGIHMLLCSCMGDSARWMYRFARGRVWNGKLAIKALGVTWVTPSRLHLLPHLAFLRKFSSDFSPRFLQSAGHDGRIPPVKRLGYINPTRVAGGEQECKQGRGGIVCTSEQPSEQVRSNHRSSQDLVLQYLGTSIRREQIRNE